MIKKIADRFFEWFCHPEYYLDIRGDLEELYQKRLQSKSKSHADLHFVKEVLLLLRLSLIKPLRISNPLTHRLMLTQHTKIALRYMRKQKIYSFIKIGGFALGVAASLLLLLFLRYELSYDQHHREANNIYRMNITWLAHDATGVEFPPPLAEALRNDYPEVENAGRLSTPVFLKGSFNLIRRGDELQNFYEEEVCLFDQELLDLLQVPMVHGDRSKALSQPNSIVISQSKAEKFFPGENPVGKTLVVNNDAENPFTIGGVMEDFPPNSHLNFHFLYTLEGVELWDGEQSSWFYNNYRTYVKLRDGTDPEQFGDKLHAILPKYYLPSFKENGLADAQGEVDSMHISIQPIGDIYLDSEVFDQLPHGDARLIWIFGVAAILILLLACINFINLSTARSANRAKEVGIRRTAGALKGHLISQFLIESLLYSFFSFLLGVLLAWIALPYFNQMLGKTLEMPWQNPWLIPILILAALIVGLLSGLYPSFYLSAFKPIQVMKGKISTGSKNPVLRNGLVVFQFVASIVLIIGTGVIYQQMHYILNTKIGFEKDQVLMLQGTNSLEEKVFTFKDQLLALPEVKHASVGDYLPIRGTKRNGTGFYQEGKAGIDDAVSGQRWRVDFDYIKTLGMNIVEGRDFSIEMPTDSQAVVINQTMVRKLNLLDPIGKQISFSGGTWRVIGIVEDFHFESLREEVQPVALYIGNSPSMICIKARSSDMAKVLASVTDVWEEFAPHQPIRYQFLDESFAMMYADVQRSGHMFSSFAGLAIIIACLGLFGLTAYMAEQRTKEIGIRKVLGASVNQVVLLLSKDFLKLVLISIVIASPIAWYIMYKWLESFAYKIDIQGWVFILAGLLTLTIAFLTMRFHSVRTASANPVEALRME